VSAALHAQTPTLTATDSRGLVVRSVQWYRADSSHEPESRVTQMRQDLLGREVENRDPRLFACAAPRPNLATIYSLSGLPLFSDSVDSGWQATLMTEDGLPVVRQDGRGTQTDYEYDELRRLTAVFETADGQARCAERFGYGGVEADHEHNLRQRLLRRDDPAGARHMLAYDLNGLTQQERQHFIEGLEAPDWPESETARDALLEDSDNYTSQWTFSPWGDQLQMIDAAGNCHRQQFSVAGRLAASSLHAAKNGTVVTLVDQISYTPLDQVQRQVAGNGLVTETTYDPADNRLMRLQCGSLQDLTYLYDPVGNVVCHEDHSV
jgi:insecticidal toxin complex protein TccC